MVNDRPSATALFVATSVVILGVGGGRPASLLPLGPIVACQQAVIEARLPHLSWAYRFFYKVVCSHWIPCRFLQFLAQTLLPPCGLEFLALRKSYMEHQVRDFLVAPQRKNNSNSSNSSTTIQKDQAPPQLKQQVLILGAGYDTLALRLAPEFPGSFLGTGSSFRRIYQRPVI